LQVAVNCCVPLPAVSVAVAGATVMLVSVALVTVRALVADTPPEAAVMVDEPAATPVARPLFDTVAAAVLLLDHVTADEQLELVLLA
jgi:hypothetical protein